MGKDIGLYDKNGNLLDVDTAPLLLHDEISNWWNEYVKNNPDKEWSITGRLSRMYSICINRPWYVKFVSSEETNNGVIVYFKLHWLYKLWLRLTP